MISYSACSAQATSRMAGTCAAGESAAGAALPDHHSHVLSGDDLHGSAGETKIDQLHALQNRQYSSARAADLLSLPMQLCLAGTQLPAVIELVAEFRRAFRGRYGRRMWSHLHKLGVGLRWEGWVALERWPNGCQVDVVDL